MDRRNELIEMISFLDTKIAALENKILARDGNFAEIIKDLISTRRAQQNLERELKLLDLSEDMDKASTEIERLSRVFTIDHGIFVACALVASLGLAFIFLI